MPSNEVGAAEQSIYFVVNINYFANEIYVKYDAAAFAQRETGKLRKFFRMHPFILCNLQNVSRKISSAECKVVYLMFVFVVFF